MCVGGGGGNGGGGGGAGRDRESEMWGGTETVTERRERGGWGEID